MVARKGANKGTTSTKPAVREEEKPSDQPEQETASVQVEEEIPSVQAIPILKEIKLEIEDMTPDEFERYGCTDKLSFGQMACLDAERARAKPTQPIKRAKEKAKAKGKGKPRKLRRTPTSQCGM